MMEYLKDKRLWVVLAALAIALWVLSNSNPASAANWSGCYIGANVGYGSVNSDVDVGFGPVGASVESFGADGATLSPTIGCDMQMQKFVVGLLADYTWHDDSAFDISLSVPGASGSLLNYETENEWMIGARAGYLITDEILAYGLIGYSKMEMSDLELLAIIPGGGLTVDLSDHEGWTLGGGVEVALGGGFYANAQYRYTDYDSEDVKIVPGLDTELDPDVQSARLGVIYKFGMGNSLAPAPMK
jgi:outer membrane immunogenic protein